GRTRWRMRVPSMQQRPRSNGGFIQAAWGANHRRNEMDTVALDPRISQPVREFIERRAKLLLIDGKLVPAKSGKTFPVYDPATGPVIAKVAEADREDVDLAVRAARRAFDDGPWARTKPNERSRLLWKLADLVETHLDELAEIESLDNGKPAAVARVAD